MKEQATPVAITRFERTARRLRVWIAGLQSTWAVVPLPLDRLSGYMKRS
jgi:hypothetical protein